ncbi:hypothetical protein K1719_033379 [Acacia pycnantha]|nr:hypothetical protein K1719_033379 [Acacia pycnantha]
MSFCVVHEHPLSVLYDEQYFGSCLKSALISLKARGYLSYEQSSESSTRIWNYIGLEKLPSHAVSIRAIETIRYEVIDQQRKRVLEEIEENKAFFQIYDGAVYMCQGKTYLVEKLDLSNRERQFSAPLLYFWYAGELANTNDCESSYRAMRILSCLGTGTKYSPYKGQPSSLQLLRARQGFKEKTRTVRSSWVRGIVNHQSVALICSVALLEEFTSGWDAVVEGFDQAFAMVLPAALSPNPNERKAAEQSLEQFQYAPQHLVRLLQIIVDNNCEWECDKLLAFILRTS